MVRRFITQELCDDCIHHDIHDVPAIVEYVLVVNGDKLRKVQLCARCDLIWQPIIAVYQQQGQEVDIPSERSAPKAAKKRKSQAVTAAKPKELAPAPEEPAAEGDTTQHLHIVCPIPHPSEGGGKRRIRYSDRSSHVDQCHEGIRIHDIKWEDPDGILKAFCERHPTPLGFTSERGVKQHVFAAHPEERQEGATQKSDEPAP